MIVGLAFGSFTVGGVTFSALRKDHSGYVVIRTGYSGSGIVLDVACVSWSHVHIGQAFGRLDRRVEELVLIDRDRAEEAGRRGSVRRQNLLDKLAQELREDLVHLG